MILLAGPTVPETPTLLRYRGQTAVAEHAKHAS